MKLEWLPREQPLAVQGCWAEGEVARKLEAKLLSRPPSGLQAATSREWLVVLGDEPPWVEGVVYLGREGNLYLPTLWQPNLPESWIAARLEQLGPAPWALVPPDKAMGLSRAAVLL